ncbi:acyl-CoA dehydrogenase family protein [Aquabacterium sp. A7-Y]|uniref:acyl-CoA dehydrogenase family protein n=1 Tax=Aquabacterium sp. A7-Y TaxID=1349605 RepID=UPI00223E1539|nr:acyl-CoA dehydrogenase family protein [Aquabacterium sp. A7-Y]MCW7540155.1 acyl-CoA dehydrogenase family protein [Aquabacterium sp. A7-Y]
MNTVTQPLPDIIADGAAEAAVDAPRRARSVHDVAQVVHALVQGFASTAALRDLQGGSPKAQRDELRRSGLLALTIPSELGGLGAAWQPTLGVVRQMARVDSSVAHLFAFHHLMLATLRLFGRPEQWRPWHEHTARLDWFWGNALNPLDRRTVCRRLGGHFEFSGKKSFCSGATDSEMLIASAFAEDDDRLVVAALPSARSGITVLQDWDNIGQRQTDSGSVNFERVRIDEDEILRDPGPLTTPLACMRPLIAQLILVNIYIGIAEGAFEDAKHYTLRQAHPWQPGDGIEPDPYVLASFGEFFVGLEGVRVLGDRAGRMLDEALALGSALGTRDRGEVANAIAVAKVASTRTGLDICNRLFEVTGARSTHAGLGLDRHWRNLRTHTLHDPVQRKLKELGDWVLGERYPTPSFYS